MATYNVRADGTEATALSATGDISSAANAMTWATFQTAIGADAFSPFDIISVSNRGGVFTGSANIAVSVDDISIIGETGHRPIVNQNGASVRFKVNNCSRSLIENIEIYGGIANGVEWTGTGTGHVIRDVHSHDHTGTGVAAFSNECTAGTVHCYGTTGNNCTDDGWSSHAGATSHIYGGNFYGNAQGINIVSDGIAYFYDCKVFGNTAEDINVGSGANAAYIYMYDCGVGGAVVSVNANTSLAYLEFHRTKFHCNAVSSTAAIDDGCLNFGNSNVTREIHSKFYGCEFLGSQGATKAQLFLRGNASSTNVMENCTMAQITETGYAIWDLLPAGGTNDMTNVNFYNALVGIHGVGNATQSITNCNFDGCTTDYAVAPDTITLEKAVASGFEQIAIGDLRLASSSSLIGIGAALSANVTHDVENRPYATADIGCYADTISRPRVPGQRPSR